MQADVQALHHTHLQEPARQDPADNSSHMAFAFLRDGTNNWALLWAARQGMQGLLTSTVNCRRVYPTKDVIAPQAPLSPSLTHLPTHTHSRTHTHAPSQPATHPHTFTPPPPPHTHPLIHTCSNGRGLFAPHGPHAGQRRPC